MPNTKSAKKRVKTDEKRRQQNVAMRSRLNTARRKFVESLDNKESASETYKTFCSVLDKSAKIGAISKNAASRRKSRAHAKLAVALEG